MSRNKFPSPEDIKKEFEQFVHNRFGNQVQLVSQEHTIPKKDNDVDESSANKTAPQGHQFSFEYKPKDIKAYLDRFVIAQEEAKKAISIALCDHYNQVNLHCRDPKNSVISHHVKQNVLILGSTGVGKTYMIKHAANLIGVPFVKADATRFSETGYMGSNADDLIKDLVNQADGDLQKAQYGIVYLDEIDKLASNLNTSGGRDVSGRGVQTGLLKLMEETDVDLKSNNDPASQIQAFIEIQQKGKVEKQIISTRHILFIFSGSFNKLDEIISRRLNKKAIGFAKTKQANNKEQLLQLATTSDFIEFGLEPEFIGRIPIRVACHHLDISSLHKILTTSKGSILKQYIADFKGYNILATFSPDAVLEIAKMAYQEQTGARGLFTTCEKILRHYKFELPSTQIKSLEISKEIILNPENGLKKILQNITSFNLSKETMKSIESFEKEFFSQHQIRLIFEEEAMAFLEEEAKKQKKSVANTCCAHTKNYEHGLKLIHQNTGQKEFYISAYLLKNPKKELEKMVKDSYGSKQQS